MTDARPASPEDDSVGASYRDAPFRPMAAPEPAVDVEARADGTVILRCPFPLEEAPPSIVSWLRHWSKEIPDRPVLARRGADGEWETISYRELRRQADAIAQWLLDHGLQGSVVMILSGNSFEHASIALGALTVGAVIAPVSEQYSLRGSDDTRLRRVVDLVRPSVVFVQSASRFTDAIATVREIQDVTVIAAESHHGVDAIALSEVLETEPSAAVDQAFGEVDHGTIAKVLFTSGSTSTAGPKGVITTHGMLTVSQLQTASLLGERMHRPLLGWSAWSHTMAGNGMFGSNLRLGGTYYLDDGRPVPGQYDRTLRNLRELLPLDTYSDVPLGLSMLADAMEQDDELRDAFFERIDRILYSTAGAPNRLFERYQRLAVASTGQRIAFVSGYGSTETSPGLLVSYWPAEEIGVIGLPIAGAEVKLVPLGEGRYEVLARGPNVTPGYYNEPDRTAEAFDEEGFFRMGDAVRFVDPDSPVRGLLFDGRLTEEFKLSSGTFVVAGTLRLEVLGATSPLLRDVVIVGRDRDDVGVLAWLNVERCQRELGGRFAKASAEELTCAPELHEVLAESLKGYNEAHPGSSRRVARMMLMSEPPSVAAGEITDKGYVNQLVTTNRRATLIDRLYEGPPADDVLVL